MRNDTIPDVTKRGYMILWDWNGTLLNDIDEVASMLGCHCILIAGGHQPYEKLITTGVHVEKNLTALFSLVTNS